jgi:hypothetical protein
VRLFITLLSIGFLSTSGAWANKIYTCTDAKGRRLSSDRPIPECLDREQKELSSSGFTRRIIPPSQSDMDRAQAMAAKEAQAQQQEQEKARLKEMERRNQLMLIRYPNQTKHDAERQSQLETVQATVTTIQFRQRELERQRKELQSELEFYKNDLSKAPPALQRRFKNNDEEIVVQQQLMRHQEEESKRINARFDEELMELRKLWGTSAPRPASTQGDSSTIRPR